MKKVSTFVCAIVIGLFPATALSDSCNPACGQGQVCCVIQYSNGTYSAPFCKTGTCYTSTTNQPLKNCKEIDAALKGKSPLPKADGKKPKPDKKDKAQH